MTEETKFVLTLLGGAVGAALLGLFGAWIQSRREHGRWIREERLAAYGAYIVALDGYIHVSLPASEPPGPAREKLMEEVNEFTSSLLPSGAMISLLGPTKVRRAAHTWRKLCGAEFPKAPEGSSPYAPQTPAIVEAREDFIATARAALDVGDPSKRTSFRMTAIW